MIGKTVYIKPSEAFWRQNLPSRQAGAVIELMRGKWLKAPLTDPRWGSFAQFADKDDMVAGLFKDVKTKKLKKKGPKTVGGIRSIGVDDGEGVLWVSVSNARPVKIDPPRGKKGTLTFSEYNAIANPKAPPAELIIDAQKLSG